MELHSSNTGNKLCDYLKAVFFMLRIKCFLSRKKFQMDMNLFMQRGKFMGKSITNLLTHPHHHSCQNKRSYFPCLKASANEGKEEGQEAEMRTPLRLEYASQELHELTANYDHSPLVQVREFSFSPSEKEEGGGEGENGEVDHEAEEFINKFYEQLKRQKEVGLLEGPQEE